MSRNYKPDPRGMAQLGQDPKLGAVCLTTALAGAAIANQLDPQGNYSASTQTVIAGWRNERRAGAVISQNSESWKAQRDRVLIQVTRAMRSR